MALELALVYGFDGLLHLLVVVFRSPDNDARLNTSKFFIKYYIDLVAFLHSVVALSATTEYKDWN